MDPLKENEQKEMPVVPPVAPGISGIRTYASDMAQALGVDSTEIPEKENIQNKDTVQNLIYSIGGACCILIGILGLVYANSVSVKNEAVKKQAPIEQPTLITHDTSVYIEHTGIVGSESVATALKKISSESVVPDKIKAVIFYTGEKTKSITTSALFTMMNANAPKELLTALTDEVMIGIYTPKNIKEKPHLFFLFSVKDSDNAHEGMALYEKTLGDDFHPFFESSSSPLAQTFEDTLVDNMIVRVLKNESGKGIMYTAFINKDYIVITDGISALSEIKRRIITENAIPL